MKCKCGNRAFILYHSQHMCWECFEILNKAIVAESQQAKASIHIDTPATLDFPRAPLCRNGLGDAIYHMTPQIAASYIAQHPDQQDEFCGGCLAAMYRDYLPAIANARLYAATRKQLPDDNEGPDLEPGV